MLFLSIGYIEDDCICSDDKALQSIKNTMSKMVRYNGQTLLDWLQSFVPIVNKYLKAIAEQELDDDEAKALWKAHFASQITLAQKSTMLIFQAQYALEKYRSQGTSNPQRRRVR
jgi:hypothetical protein